MRARQRAPPVGFGRQCLRQARAAQRMRDMLAGMAGRIAGHSSRFAEDGPWEAIRAACGEGTFGGLASRVGLDPATATAREVFLEALSTVATYATAWGIVLRFSEGSDREMFLDAWRMECDVNGMARQMFLDAAYFYRGESVAETVGVGDRSVGPSLYRSFVSLSSNPMIAIEFAFATHVKSSKPTVVLVIDAHEAKAVGIVPATYSLASCVLDLQRSEESVDRTFPLGLAHEVQAHFHDRWPHGSEGAMVAIITISSPTTEERHGLASIGLPIMDYADIFSQRL